MSTTNNSLSRLAATLFVAGPTDSLVAKDVYGINTSNIINSLVGKLSGFDSSGLESIRRSAGPLGALSGLVSNAVASFISPTSGLSSRVSNAINGRSGTINDLSTALLGSITNGVNIPASLYRRGEVTVGGLTRNFSTDNMVSASGLMGVINQMVGSVSYAVLSDVGADANALSGVVSGLITYGLSDMIEDFTDQAPSQTAVKAALVGNMSTALANGDLTAINLIVNKSGPGLILANQPDAGLRVIKSYKLPSGTPASGYPTEAAKLLNVLNALAPNWDSYLRNGVPILDLTYFSAASDDARTVLRTHSAAYADACSIAGNFPKVDLLTYGKSLYPYAVLT